MFRMAMTALLLTGCAAAPAGMIGDLPAQPLASIDGVQWRAVAIDGAPVTSPAPDSLTLRFKDGRAGGRAGCNHYGGQFELLPEARIRFGILAATRMLCRDEAMALERRFFDAIGETMRYALGPDGSLLLTGENGRSIRFERVGGP